MRAAVLGVVLALALAAGAQAAAPRAKVTSRPQRCRATWRASGSSRPTTTATTASAPARRHTRIPGLDNQAAFARTGLVPETDMQRSFDPGQPAVVIDADSGTRHLIWAELDANPASDADRNLFIRPGTNFEEGHRYIVALRNLERETARRSSRRARSRSTATGLLPRLRRSRRGAAT